MTVSSGFLGAGKSTLLRELLARCDGRQLAVLVNDMAQLGLDGEFLRLAEQAARRCCDWSSTGARTSRTACGSMRS
ncbi:MAG: hypothetical protein JNN27_15355 [Planctomycetes bacterium]|nr:hypothetical protein [Planctomycetota bacterium]